jgi:putative glutamine amidotransferase
VTTRPLIGVTGRRVPPNSLPGLPAGLAHMPVDIHFTDYTASLAAAGAIPVTLTRDAPVEPLLDRLDGLVLSGGADVSPELYGATPDDMLGGTEPDRDAWEIALYRGAVARAMPVLAICRGMQLMNVFFGGTLRQHVGLDEGAGHPNWHTDGRARTHGLVTAPDSILRQLLGESLDVNSLHHQTVQDLAPGLRVAATAPDGVVEGVEHETLPMVGVQWHPEMLGNDPVFSWIVREAGQYAAR